MSMSGRRKLALLAGGLVVAQAVRTRSSRPSVVDPCGPEGLTLPAGDRVTVSTDDGATLSAYTAGPPDGPVVVLAHCWMGSITIWGAVARQLVESGHRVILWDQRGHGESTLGRDPITVDRLGHDLHLLLGAFDVADAVLIGHSMGGMTIQAYAAHYPDDFSARVRGVVLAATAPHSGRVKVSPRVATALLGDRRTAGLAKRPPSSMGPYAHVDSVAATHASMVGTAGVARAGFLVAMGQMDYRPALANIGVPTKIFVGTKDRLTPPVRAQELLAGIPDAELTVLDGYRHMLPFEAPAPLVAAVQEMTTQG